MSEHPTFLVGIDLFGDRLMRVARERKVLSAGADDGYLLHTQLTELFGEDAPKPFAQVGSEGRRLQVLGYSPLDHHQLRSIADRNCGPLLHGACDWTTLKSKRLPTCWETGHRLGFETRVCPVVRMHGASKHHRKGAEVDAFLRRCWLVDDRSVPINREDVYRDWLAGHLERNGAQLVRARIVSFIQDRLLRRTQGANRKAKGIQRPNALMRGELVVTDGEQFSALIRRGVGRHRAFGFGMLLLAPARG